MSRRPVTPSEHHGLYMSEGDVEAHHADAPRLPTKSVVVRVAACSLLLCCCVAFVAFVMWSIPFWLSVASVQRADAQRERHPQRSVLRRMAMLKRTQQGHSGIDVDSVRFTFPEWLDERNTVVADRAIGDVLLALSYLAQEKDVAHATTTPGSSRVGL